jgi:hypothetical protein
LPRRDGPGLLRELGDERAHILVEVELPLAASCIATTAVMGLETEAQRYIVWREAGILASRSSKPRCCESTSFPSIPIVSERPTMP